MSSAKLPLWKPSFIQEKHISRVKTLIEPPQLDGKVIGVDRRKLYEYPFWLTVDAPNQAVVVPANSTVSIQTGRVSGLGPVEITKMSCLRTGAMQAIIQIMDGDHPVALMNGAIHVDCIFGDNELPYRLSEAAFIEERRPANFIFTDLSGSENAIRPALHGVRYTAVKYDPRLTLIRQRLSSRQYITMPFFYTFDTGRQTVTGNGTTRATISIGEDFNFELMKISALATSDLYTIDIIDVARSKSLIDAPNNANYGITAGLWMGTNLYPFVLPEPVLLEAGTLLEIVLTDLSGVDNTIDLALHGRNIRTRMWQ